MTLMLDLSSGN